LNIVSPILAQARFAPAALAICMPGAPQPHISYGRLAAMLNNVANHAHSVGLRRGDTVAISIDDPVLALVLTLGLLRVGLVTLVPGAFAVPQEIEVAVTLTGGARSGRSAIHADREWLAGDGKLHHASDEPDGSETAHIVLTSGTTGEPKGVALTHDNLARRVAIYTYAFGERFSRSSRLFVDVGIASNFGLQCILWVLSRGGALFLRGPDPAETLQAFDLYKVQAMVASPWGLSEFLKYYEQSPSFACPFDVILAGGGLTWKSLGERVRARMCTHLVTGYGASEISPVAAALNHEICDIAGAVGYLSAGVTVQTVDEGHRVLPSGETGIIRIRGATAVDGYVGNPPGSELAFRDGWFYPGDIGSVTQDGVLIVSGRRTAVLNVGGNKIGAEAIEQIVLNFAGVEQAGAFAVENELGIAEVWVAIVAPGTLDESGLHRHCQASLSAQFVPRRFLLVPALPRNANGKLDRRKLAELSGPAVQQ